MVNSEIVSAIKNIAMAGVGAGVTIVALFKGIDTTYTMTALVSYYAYYGVHVYNSNKISQTSNAVKQ